MAEDLRGRRLATPDDAFEVTRLLHDFQHRVRHASPGVDVLADRLRVLLASDQTMAILAGMRPWPAQRRLQLALRGRLVRRRPGDPAPESRAGCHDGASALDALGVCDAALEQAAV